MVKVKVNEHGKRIVANTGDDLERSKLRIARLTNQRDAKALLLEMTQDGLTFGDDYGMLLERISELAP